MNEKIKAAIVDDDPYCRETLKDVASRRYSSIQFVTEAENVEQGLLRLRSHHVDLLFLDVQMPDGSGFDLLKSLGKFDFEVIFTTSFNHYAIDAIRHSALDYLLKPVTAEAFDAAISRYFQKLEILNTRNKNLHNAKMLFNPMMRLALPSAEGLIFVNIQDIIRIESDKNYSWIFLAGKRKELITKPIGECESLLNPNNFLRVHHSHLINLNHVEKYVKGEGGYVIMTDGSSVDVSRRKKEEFIERLAKI